MPRAGQPALATTKELLGAFAACAFGRGGGPGRVPPRDSATSAGRTRGLSSTSGRSRGRPAHSRVEMKTVQPHASHPAQNGPTLLERLPASADVAGTSYRVASPLKCSRARVPEAGHGGDTRRAGYQLTGHWRVEWSFAAARSTMPNYFATCARGLEPILAYELRLRRRRPTGPWRSRLRGRSGPSVPGQPLAADRVRVLQLVLEARADSPDEL